MAKGAVDISFFGVQSVRRMFDRLPHETQHKVIKPLLRESAYLSAAQVAAVIPLGPPKKAGMHLRDTIAKALVRAPKGQRYRNRIRVGWLLPTRATLGLPATGGYYPTALEYGWLIKTKTGTKKIAPKAYIRRTTNRHKAVHMRMIASRLRAKIIPLARKLGRRMAT